MLRARRSAARLIAVGVLTLAVACDDPRSPTAPPPTANAAVTAAAGANNGKIKIRMMQLSANTVRIDGPAVSAAVTVSNSGSDLPSGMSLRAEIAQPASVHQAAALPTKCSPGDASGSLPGGNCDMTFSVNASNSGAGVGTFVVGPAVFVLRVMQSTGGTQTEVASKTVDISLVASPAITSLTLAKTTLGIGGAGANYTATLQNPANSLQGVLLQSYITQAGVRRAAGGVSVSCGSAIGVLPPGSCAITFSFSASNGAAGTGTLTPGPAQFELNLIQNNGGTATTFDTRSVPITLVSIAPAIASITMSSTTLTINGPSVGYTAQLRNGGASISGVGLQGYIEQTTGAGTASRPAGGLSIDCGSGLGVLPNLGVGTCTINFTTLASNSLSGTGTLVPGPARFVLHLFRSAGGVETELDSRTVDVTLVDPQPTIVSVTPTSTFLVLGGGLGSYTALLDNPGSTKTDVLLQGWISQGVARRASGGQTVHCTATFGELPNGACTVISSIAARNDPAAGTGTLVPGSATFELELKVAGVVVDTKTAAITLVATTPSIVSLELSTPTIAIGGSTPYTVTIYNPTGATLTSTVFVQGYMEQTGGTSYGGGGSDVQCGSPGAELPPGACTFSFVAVASNSAAGTGVLVSGAATFRLQLIQNSTVLDERVVSVTLTNP